MTESEECNIFVIFFYNRDIQDLQDKVNLKYIQYNSIIMTLLYKELTRKILASCFEVSNELGSGFFESVYEKALFIALKQSGISVLAQYPIEVSFRGIIVGQILRRPSGGKYIYCLDQSSY
jgi:PD-(D/E)XK nuclease superfamily